MLTLISADIMEKLKILSDAAKFDVACTSSGTSRLGNGKDMGSTFASGICHSFTADGRCISLLKILFTNECIYDCRYCINRCTNDVERVTFTPEEVCKLTIEFYRRNYIEGLFLSSGIIESPEHTMRLLYTTLFLLRNKYHFNGYIHIKGIPGASSEILEMIGYLCDRMSVNLELPTAEGLRAVAPNKARKNILTPMRFIQNGIKDSRMYHGNRSMKNRMYIDEQAYYEQMAEIKDSAARLSEYHRRLSVASDCEKADRLAEKSWGLGALLNPGVVCETTDVSYGNSAYINKTGLSIKRPDRYYVPAGQSTQMIVGATGESDYQIISVAEAMYNRFDMKRVFYSAFVNVNMDESLPGIGIFNAYIDPKCQWAVGHLECFPVEIMTADYYTLLRVPGIGTNSVRRIIKARKHAKLTFTDLKKMGVVLKRALYFITCDGRMMYNTKLDESYITRHLIYNERPDTMLLADNKSCTYEQMSIFDFISE